MKKTNIKVLVDNKEKVVYQNEFTGELYIKYQGEELKCSWVNDDKMEVAFYGCATAYMEV